MNDALYVGEDGTSYPKLPETGQATAAGIRFGPIKSGKKFHYYIATNKHRGGSNKHDPSIWILTPREEFAIFEVVVSSKSYCETTKHCWGFGNREGTRNIGKRNEKLSRYPLRSNKNDDWHGYPFSKPPRSNKKEDGWPGEELVLGWLEDGLIEKEFGLKILRGAL